MPYTEGEVRVSSAWAERWRWLTALEANVKKCRLRLPGQCVDRWPVMPPRSRSGLGWAVCQSKGTSHSSSKDLSSYLSKAKLSSSQTYSLGWEILKGEFLARVYFAAGTRLGVNVNNEKIVSILNDIAFNLLWESDCNCSPGWKCLRRYLWLPSTSYKKIQHHVSLTRRSPKFPPGPKKLHIPRIVVGLLHLQASIDGTISAI